MKSWRAESFENGVALALATREAGSVVIFKMRHGKTTSDGCITSEFWEYNRRQGELFAQHGLRFDHVSTSGEPRAVGSVLAACHGAGYCPRLHTTKALRPVEREPGFDKPAFKAKAQELGIKPWVHLNTAPKYQDMIHRAGKDAAQHDLKLSKLYAGQIIAQGVHNGYQAEKGIQWLENPDGAPFSEPPAYFDDGQIGVLILDSEGNFMDFYFFPAPAEYFG